jgi:hypothetical protein
VTDAITIQNPRNRGGSTGHVLAKRSVTFTEIRIVIHNSMDATIRAGKALGYSIILPSDATTAVPVTGPGGTRWGASTVYELTLAILGAEYAEVMSSDDVIAQLSE